MAIHLQPYAHPQPPEAPVRSLATMHELSVEDVIAQVVKIQQVMAQAMKKDEHYGIIPGATKPSLLKAGAEKLCLVFRLDPQYEIVQEIPDGFHRTYIIRCVLYHIPTGQRMGSGLGACSTREKKYAFRMAKRACPKCGAEAINRSKFPPKDKRKHGAEPGWYCYAKAGGCGLEFAANDGAIIDQPLGQVVNPDLPDLWNTVLKMGAKRSHIAAVLNVTAASDIFTQDVEDYPEGLLPKSPVVTEPVTATPSVTDEMVIDTDADVEPTATEPTVTQTRPTAAGIEEWLAAFDQPSTAKGLQALWKGVTAPDLWKEWSQDDQVRLIAAKNAAKVRLGIE